MAGMTNIAFWICLLFWQARCQIVQAPADLTNYPDLSNYELPGSSNGSFTYPTFATPVYGEGTEMTIAWTTDYEYVNLYIVYTYNISLAAPLDSGGNHQRQLLAGAPTKPSDTYAWTITCAPDCNAPYEFHLVNARGTENEVNLGGFWSDYFWISPLSKPSTSSSTSTSTTPTATSSSTTANAVIPISASSQTTTTTSSTSTSTSSLAASSRSSATSSQITSTTSANAASASGTASSSGTPTSEPLLPPPTGTTEPSGLSTGAKAGIGVGAAVVALGAIAFGVLLCLRKRRSGKEPMESMPYATYDGDNTGMPVFGAMSPRSRAASPQYSHLNSFRGQKPAGLSEMQSVERASELATAQDPHELEGSR